MFHILRQDFRPAPSYPNIIIMTDNKQEPQFLGGGPKFNRAGAQPPDAEQSETAPSATPTYPIRSLLIVLAVIALIGLLYWITTGPNGLIHVGGHGGTSPNARPTPTDSSAGP